MDLTEVKNLYSAAYAHYESGLYTEAGDLFTQLTLMDPQEESFWRGLAASRQMGQKYTSALYAWGVVSILSKDDPLTHLHAAECLLSLQKKEEAKAALNAALQLAKDNSQLCIQIEALKQGCKAEVNA